MWQTIAVGVIVVAAALFAGYRIWRAFAATGKGEVCSACGCSGCGEDKTAGPDCRPT